jgi:hypothetical protein
MKKILFLLLMVFSGFTASAQPESIREFKHFVGFDAGGSNGFGLSYRYMPSKWGVQVNGFPIGSPHYYSISAGLTIMRSLYENERMRFFVYYGNHLIFEKQETEWYYNGTDYTETDGKSTQWNTGAGPGFEVYIAKRLALNVRFGIGYYHYGVRNWKLNPDGGIGLHFRL